MQLKKLNTILLCLMTVFLSCQSPQPVARYSSKSPSKNSKSSDPKTDSKASEKQKDNSPDNQQAQPASRFKIGEAPTDVLMSAINNWIGTPYRYGGMSKSGIDCSGFTTMIFSEVYGIQLPRRAKEQYLLGRGVDKDNLKQGDLVFFQLPRTRAVSHVGIYISDGQFAHASTSSGVMISNLGEDYWVKLYKGARRIN